MYEDDDVMAVGNPEDVIERELLWPHPIDTDWFKITVVEGQPDVNMKIELLGMTANERYGLNPYLDHQPIEKGVQ